MAKRLPVGTQYRIHLNPHRAGWAWRVYREAVVVASGAAPDQEAAEWTAKDWIFERQGETVGLTVGEEVAA